MSAVAEREREARPPAPGRFTKGRRRRPVRSLLRRESVVLFAVAYAGYAVLGWLVVVRWHIVVGDGVSRLAHAYFVWFNAPPKLAAIGFVWPPLMTLVLLPLAAVKPLATSLLALPLVSALFASGLVVVLDLTLDFVGMSRLQRLPLVALVAFNPMILYYAANGMGEVVYLFFLALAIYGFVRWSRRRDVYTLILMSGALTLGVLTRYELLFWAALIGVGIVTALARSGYRSRVIEGTALTFVAPIAYGFGLWLFFNWLILGDPLWWLHAEVTQTFVETRRDETAPTHLALIDSTRRTVALTWGLYPATFIVIAALALHGILRRSLVSMVLSAALLLNPLTTAVLGATTQTDVVFQLRYNIRVIPLVLIGMGWLWYVTGSTGRRRAVWLAAAALMAGSIPSTWHMMQTYRQQALEQAFTRALVTLSDQEGKQSLGIGVPVGNKPEREAAEWILEHVSSPDSILADDALSFEVILFTGRPDLFVDRTDQGDDHWYRVRDAPFGRVDYMLISSQGIDRITLRYPELSRGETPAAMRRVFANSRWTVVRLTDVRERGRR